jgi:site-specific recombinase XerD
LRRHCKTEAVVAEQLGQSTAPRVWMLVDLLTCTGLRRAEAAALRCGDLRLDRDSEAVIVRNGKGAKPRVVHISTALAKHLREFLVWRSRRGERVDATAPLFVGKRGAWSPAAVRDAVRKALRDTGLYQRFKCTHALRHSYAVALYRVKRDLRATQKQLGHASVRATEIYADVLPDDIRRQVEELW